MSDEIEEALKAESKRLWPHVRKMEWFAGIGIGFKADSTDDDPVSCLVLMTKRDLTQVEKDAVHALTIEPVEFLTTGEFRLLAFDGKGGQ